MSTLAGFTRRTFFSEVLRDLGRGAAMAKECLDEAAGLAEFFSSPESSYGVTLHYPREFFEADAERLGIDIDKVGLDEAVRRIIEDQRNREAGRDAE